MGGHLYGLLTGTAETCLNKLFVTDTSSLYRDFGCAELDCTLQFYKQEKRNSIRSFIIKHDLFPITQAAIES